MIQALTPPEAQFSGDVVLYCEPENEGDPEPYCAQGLKSVSLDAGGSVDVTTAIPSGIGSAFVQLIYRSEAGANVDVVVGGQTYSLMLDPTTGAEAGTVDSPEFSVSPGQTLTISSPSGGVEIDAVNVFGYEGVADAVEALPEGWALGTSFPNPAAGTATIRFALGEAAPVRLDVFDVLGRRVSTLADGLMTAGEHEVRLDARGLASGTYVYRLSTPVGIQARRLTIVR